MSKFLIGGAVALALTSPSGFAGSFLAKGDMVNLGVATGEQIWLAKDNGKGNGNGQGGGHKKILKKSNGNSDHGKRGNGNGKPAHAGGPKAKPDRKDVGRASNGHGNGANARRPFTAVEREDAVSRLVSTRAPEGRDMLRILGTSALALATPQLLVSDIPEADLIRYSNCPPGLAKKDPPCVAPGLATKGVTYDEWASYDQDEYDAIWLDRREEWLRSRGDINPDPERLLLQSDQIARLYDLDPAPEGHRYALIDGLPVLLDDKDYSSLLMVNQMAQVPDVRGKVPIAPTAWTCDGPHIAATLTNDRYLRSPRMPRCSAASWLTALCQRRRKNQPRGGAKTDHWLAFRTGAEMRIAPRQPRFPRSWRLPGRVGPAGPIMMRFSWWRRSSGHGFVQAGNCRRSFQGC